jgi:hypothetical protein
MKNNRSATGGAFPERSGSMGGFAEKYFQFNKLNAITNGMTIAFWNKQKRPHATPTPLAKTARGLHQHGQYGGFPYDPREHKVDGKKAI